MAKTGEKRIQKTVRLIRRKVTGERELDLTTRDENQVEEEVLLLHRRHAQKLGVKTSTDAPEA